MAKNLERQLAKEIYKAEWQDKVTYAEIAERVGVNPGTITAWAVKDNWEEEVQAELGSRRDINIIAHRVVLALLKQVEEVVDCEAGITSKDIDMLVKAANALDKLRDKHSAQQAMFQVNRFVKWLRVEDLALAQSLMKSGHIDRYYEDCVKQQNQQA